MRINRSLTRSAACITFSCLLLIAVFARPALAQSSDDATSPDSKTPVSKLSVSPLTLSFNVNIDKGVFDQTKSFKIKNGGTIPLHVTVGAPSNPDFVITSGQGSRPRFPAR